MMKKRNNDCYKYAFSCKKEFLLEIVEYLITDNESGVRCTKLSMEDVMGVDFANWKRVTKFLTFQINQ